MISTIGLKAYGHFSRNDDDEAKEVFCSHFQQFGSLDTVTANYVMMLIT